MMRRNKQRKHRKRKINNNVRKLIEIKGKKKRYKSGEEKTKKKSKKSQNDKKLKERNKILKKQRAR